MKQFKEQLVSRMKEPASYVPLLLLVFLVGFWGVSISLRDKMPNSPAAVYTINGRNVDSIASAPSPSVSPSASPTSPSDTPESTPTPNVQGQDDTTPTPEPDSTPQVTPPIQNLDSGPTEPTTGLCGPVAPGVLPSSCTVDN